MRVRSSRASLLALFVGFACGRDAPAPTATLDWDVRPATSPQHGAATGALGAPPEPMDLRSLELETAPAEGAEPGSWVRCLGGTMIDGERRFEVCRDGSQTWVDVTADKVVITASATHARTLASQGRTVRFVGGRARVEVELRPLMAALAADRIVAETALHVQVAIEHELGVARGELHLVTPRALALVSEVAGRPIRFTGEEVISLPADPSIMILGPAGEGVRYAPQVALAAIDVIAVDHGTPETLPPCEGSAAARVVRPIELAVIDRRSGRRLGLRRWPAPAPGCEIGDPPRVEAPSEAELLEGVRATLAEARARGAEPHR